MCLCLSVLEKKLNNLRWNEWGLMKFSGLLQLCTSNFWAWVSDRPASRVCPWAKKWPVSSKSISSLHFCPTGLSQTFLDSTGLGLKNGERNFVFWGRAQNIGVWMGGYLWENFIFWNYSFLPQIEPLDSNSKLCKELSFNFCRVLSTLRFYIFFIQN